MESSDCLHTQLSFCVLLCAQLSGNFLKLRFFPRKKGAKFDFSNFSVLSYKKFKNSLFSSLLKHYKIGVWALCCVFLLKETKKAKNDNWNFWILVLFCPKWPFRDAFLFFKNWFAETPIFKVFGGERFRAKLSKNENVGIPPPKRLWLITEKSFFGCFWFFLCFPFFVFFCFFLGFKGQVRWPEGPPHLALKPSFFALFCFILGLFFFWGRFKGQVRWPKGPATSLGSKASLFFVCFVFFVLCFFSQNFCFFEEKPVFLKKGALFVYFSLFPFVFPPFFVSRPFFTFSFAVSLPFFFLPCFPSCLFF